MPSLLSSMVFEGQRGGKGREKTPIDSDCSLKYFCERLDQHDPIPHSKMSLVVLSQVFK